MAIKKLKDFYIDKKGSTKRKR